MVSQRQLLTFWFALYVFATAAIGWWLLQVRADWLRQAERPELRAGWEAWKAEVRSREAAGDGPVRRRVPTAQEPPATILLRDHFLAIVGTAWLVWTAFFGFVSMTLTGAIRTASPTPSRETSQTSRGSARHVP